MVSIHVPARGTTELWIRNRSSRQCFNPRSRKGNDGREEDWAKRWRVSIHVPARGTTRGTEPHN